MGLSASQARFLQLTARKSNIEYQAQQINFQRLQWADKLSQASEQYQDKTSNRKMIYSYNSGDGITQVDVTYTNYKNYMNQQMEGLTTAQDRLFLVSSSGNKIIVANEEERDAMIQRFTQDADDGSGNSVQTFGINDFLIVDDLDDVDNFQNAIQNGIYYFAKLGENSETGERQFKTESWDSIGGGAISEDYDYSDDAQAEAEYKVIQDKVQNIDKKLELQLNQLETERDAIQKEIESVSKVIDDNVESSFKTFS